MALWQRNASIKLSNTWDARCVTNCASGTMRRSAMLQNNITEVMVTTAGKATSTIATTTSDRIATTAVIIITTTNKKRNKRTRPLLIAATRYSSHALCTGRIASTPPRSATRTTRTTNVKFKTKNLNRRCITMMHATQVMMMSRALAPIHRSQVRTQCQPLARAKKPWGWELSSSYW
jgi:hypothetical protein